MASVLGAAILTMPDVAPNTNHSIDAPPSNVSWSRYLRPNARRDITHRDMPTWGYPKCPQELARAKEKAMKVCRQNQKNSVRHAKGMDSTTIRPGKGKRGANLNFEERDELSFAEDELSGLAEYMSRQKTWMLKKIEVVRKHNLRGDLLDKFKMGQRVEVMPTNPMETWPRPLSYGMAVVTCHGGYKCCCGYKRINQGIGVTYDDGSKYHCSLDQLRIPDVPIDECDSNSPSNENSSSPVTRAPDTSHMTLSSEKFTLVARTIDGKEHLIPNVSVEMTIQELKRCIFSCTGIPSRAAQIVCGEHVLHGRRMIGEQGVTGPDAHVTIARRAIDIKAWNLLLRDLLVAITDNDIAEARHLVNSYVECKGEFRLAHALQSAYFRDNTDVAWFLFENAPAEVLFQALAMNGSRPYNENRCHGRMCVGGAPSTSLIGFMYVMGDSEALQLVGQRLGAKWYQRLRRQATAEAWEDIDYYTGHAWLEGGQRVTSAPFERYDGHVQAPRKIFEIDWRTTKIQFKEVDKQQDGEIPGTIHGRFKH